jgi:peptide/nickel transport system permease protein
MKFFVTTVKKACYSLILLLSVIILNFLLIHIAPGDPVQTIIGEMGGATPEIIEKMRSSYGLDKPIYEQLIIYLKKVTVADFGYSFYFNEPVYDLISQRVFATVLLAFSALSLAVTTGTFLGVTAARKPNGLFNQLISALALFGYSAPVFWIGLMLLIMFASFFPIFPVSGMYDVTMEYGALRRLVDILHHLILPMVTLSVVYLAMYSRMSRASMMDVLGSDYIRTARAKGLSENAVIYKHALKNSILPVITMAGLQMGYLLSGSVLVETVFAWPGLGRLAYESILRRDYPTTLGLLFFSTLIVVVANFTTDLCYRLVDPRIKVE